MAEKKTELDVVRTKKVFGMLEVFEQRKRGKPVQGQIILKWTEAKNQPPNKD